MLPAIVLSSHTMGLAVIRSLGEMGVPVVVVYYEKGDMGYVSKYVKEAIFAPHPEKVETEFLTILKDISDRYGRGLLLPVDDATLFLVSKHKKDLQNHFIVACTEGSIIKKILDKKYTYQLAKTIGVPAPETIVPGSITEAEGYALKTTYPFLVKPCYSHRHYEIFGTKMIKVDNYDQALAAYKMVTDVGLEVMFQELIPGDDTKGVNYNSYFWNGTPLIEFTSEKVRLSPPSFGVPRVVISKEIPEIIEPARRIIRALNFYGYSCAEFKRDVRDGTYKLMEVNGRHNRSARLAVRCGINFPWIEYQHLVLGRVPTSINYQKNIYWIDEFRDLYHSIEYRKTERFALRQFLNPYINRKSFATFDAKDLKPFIKRCFDILKLYFYRKRVN